MNFTVFLFSQILDVKSRVKCEKQDNKILYVYGCTQTEQNNNDSIYAMLRKLAVEYVQNEVGKNNFSDTIDNNLAISDYKNECFILQKQIPRSGEIKEHCSQDLKEPKIELYYNEKNNGWYGKPFMQHLIGVFSTVSVPGNVFGVLELFGKLDDLTEKYNKLVTEKDKFKQLYLDTNPIKCDHKVFYPFGKNIYEQLKNFDRTNLNRGSTFIDTTGKLIDSSKSPQEEIPKPPPWLKLTENKFSNTSSTENKFSNTLIKKD